MNTLVNARLTEIYVAREKAIARIRALAHQPESAFVLVSVSDLREILAEVSSACDWEVE